MIFKEYPPKIEPSNDGVAVLIFILVRKRITSTENSLVQSAVEYFVFSTAEQ